MEVELDLCRTERELYGKLALVPSILDPCTSVSDVLLVSETTAPSNALKIGGWLFELYVLRFGKKKHANKLHKKISSHQIFDEKDRASYRKHYQIPFWFHIITAIHKVNKIALLPLERFTYMLEYFGLSRMGMHLLAVCDVAIRPNSSDRHRQKENVSYDAETQKIIAGGSAVICFDNYNHAFGSAAIKLNRKTNMLLMNMTVCGLSIMSHHVDQDFRIDVDGIEHSSIPTTKLILKDYLEQMITKVEDTLDNLNHEVSSPFAYYEISRVVEEKTQTVPLTSKRKREEDVDECDRFSLNFFRPAFVSGRDTTANLGMAHIMSRIVNNITTEK